MKTRFYISFIIFTGLLYNIPVIAENTAKNLPVEAKLKTIKKDAKK